MAERRASPWQSSLSPHPENYAAEGSRVSPSESGIWLLSSPLLSFSTLQLQRRGLVLASSKTIMSCEPASRGTLSQQLQLRGQEVVSMLRDSNFLWPPSEANFPSLSQLKCSVWSSCGYTLVLKVLWSQKSGSGVKWGKFLAVRWYKPYSTTSVCLVDI